MSGYCAIRVLEILTFGPKMQIIGMETSPLVRVSDDMEWKRL